MYTRDLFELVLCVKDAAVSANFYRDAVGLEPIAEPEGGWAGFWVGKKEENRWLGLRSGSLLYEQHSPLPEGRRFGPVHFALRVPASDLENALQRLRDHNVAVYGPETWEPGRFEGVSYYFFDPDANLLEFCCPVA